MTRPAAEHDLAAVQALATRLGLGGVEPQLLKLAKHTSVRLGAVVARVQSAGRLDEAREAMTREVAVARHLARLGAPAVRPTVHPPPGPYEIGGAMISLWAWLDLRPAAEVDAASAGAALSAFHAGLARYGGTLPAYTDAIAACAALAQDPAAMAAVAPDDRALLSDLVCAGLRDAPADPTDWIALHGDTHLGNVMVTSGGPIWADLEAVCRGPLEWDLCNQPPALVACFEGVDRALLDRLGALRRACVAVWCWADAARSPEVAGAAAYHTARLRREAAVSRFA